MRCNGSGELSGRVGVCGRGRVGRILSGVGLVRRMDLSRRRMRMRRRCRGRRGDLVRVARRRGGGGRRRPLDGRLLRDPDRFGWQARMKRKHRLPLLHLLLLFLLPLPRLPLPFLAPLTRDRNRRHGRAQRPTLLMPPPSLLPSRRTQPSPIRRARRPPRTRRASRAKRAGRPRREARNAHDASFREPHDVSSVRRRSCW